MPETDEQRALRRASSAWLTKQINTVAFAQSLGSAIRGEVLVALANLARRFQEINRHLKDEYAVRHDRDLVRFYLKGGNAFECIRDPGGAAATQAGGGESDWDTQVVIDPWAPAPLRNRAYSLVEDIVLDEFRQASQRIAVVESDYTRLPGFQRDFVEEIKHLWVHGPQAPAPAYTLEYDDPQTVRKIYDRDELGLWTDTRAKLGDKNIEKPRWMPGHLFNASIKPFDLYRLGYTWHMIAPEVVLPMQDPPLEIKKPLLMELIDVTIPRRDTIEAVSVWQEIEDGHIALAPAQVTVTPANPNGTPRAAINRALPLPNLEYHLRELLTMMCEVADGSSHHEDKIIKRFQRFHLIWGILPHADITEVVNDFVGANDVPVRPVPVPGTRSYDRVNQYAQGGERANFGLEVPQPHPPLDSYLLAWRMMLVAEQQTVALQGGFTPQGVPSAATLQRFAQARATLGASPYLAWLSRSFTYDRSPVRFGPGRYAYSDDLTLVDWLLENRYLNVGRMRFSGVDQALVVRVANWDQLQMVTGNFLSLFAAEAPRHPATQNLAVHHKFSQTTRGDGITHECTFAIVDRKKAIAFLTLTTASVPALPFVPSPAEDARPVPYVPLAEIGRQRRMAAALLEDYIIKTALSAQYDLIKEVIAP